MCLTRVGGCSQEKGRKVIFWQSSFLTFFFVNCLGKYTEFFVLFCLLKNQKSKILPPKTSRNFKIWLYMSSFFCNFTSRILLCFYDSYFENFAPNFNIPQMFSVFNALVLHFGFHFSVCCMMFTAGAWLPFSNKLLGSLVILISNFCPRQW